MATVIILAAESASLKTRPDGKVTCLSTTISGAGTDGELTVPKLTGAATAHAVTDAGPTEVTRQFWGKLISVTNTGTTTLQVETNY